MVRRIQEAEFANQLINHAAGLGGMSSLSKQPEVAEESPTSSTAELAQQPTPTGGHRSAARRASALLPLAEFKRPNDQFGYPASNQRLPNPLAHGCQLISTSWHWNHFYALTKQFLSVNGCRRVMYLLMSWISPFCTIRVCGCLAPGKKKGGEVLGWGYLQQVPW